MTESRVILEAIYQEGLFTRKDTFDVFLQKLCQRFARMYNEILPYRDHDLIVKKLKEKGEI